MSLFNDKFQHFKLETNARDIQMNIKPSGKFILNIKNLSKYDVLTSNFSIEEIYEYLKERTRTFSATSFFNDGKEDF